MASNHHLFSLLSLLVFSLLLGQASAGHYHPRRPINSYKLFVFGDSYVDTGNTDPESSSAWMFPYGITSFGVASGRFSDGRVLTDYVARHFPAKKSPIPFTAWGKVETKSPESGMNFAFGGTGVLINTFPRPNMTTQIKHFQNLTAYSIFTSNDLNSSFALVSSSGNDYFSYRPTNRSRQELEERVNLVVGEIEENLKRIDSLGMKKVVVVGLGPIGCYPKFTAPAFNTCNDTMNKRIAKFHNSKLKEAVEKLNKKKKGIS